MVYLLTAFLASLALTLILVRHKYLPSRHCADGDLAEARKDHMRSMPRAGGVALVLAVLASSVPLAYREPQMLAPLLLIWACSLPAFAGGLAGDLGRRASVRLRFLFVGISGVLAYCVLDAQLIRVNVLGIDWLLQYAAVSFIATLIVIGGAASAINIIDGCNGLAAVVAALIFAGFAYVAYCVGDRLLLVMSACMIGAICGFLVWNYPNGLIFLGEGGAYFIGYMIGVVAVLLLGRHANVSAWFPLLLCFYPVFEALFSIYRKVFLRGMSPARPDRLHLHMLIYRRVVRWADAGPGERRREVQRNAMTSPFLWAFSFLAGATALLFWQSEPVLIGFTCLFVVAYMLLYRVLVRFRVPKWMVVRKRQG